MRRILLAGAALLAACGGCDRDTTGPSDDGFASVAGTYRGTIPDDITFKLTIKQSRGDLEGTYAWSADYGSMLSVGTVTGSISRGDTAAVTFHLQEEYCAENVTDWEGVFDPANRVVTITGDIQFYHQGFFFCVPWRGYHVTAILSRL